MCKRNSWSCRGSGRGQTPNVLAKSAESRDSKVLPERSWAEERARVRKSLILKDRKNAEEFSTARVMFTPAEGKEVEFRLMEKWTSEFKPDQQAKKPQM